MASDRFDDFVSARDRALAAKGVVAGHRRLPDRWRGRRRHGRRRPGRRLHAIDLPGFGATDQQLARMVGEDQATGASLGVDELARIEQPVRLVWGRSDPFGGPGVARAVAGALGDGELELVDGGHAPWVAGAPAVARALIPFLRANAGARAAP